MTTLDIPSLPGGKRVPSTGEMVALLLRAVPEPDRVQAGRLLNEIVSAKVVDLASHPRPRRLVEAAYDEVAEPLREAHPEDRLPALRRLALHTRIEEMGTRALGLAVARYLKEHPEVEKEAGGWIDESVERWRQMPVSEIQREATRQLDLLEKWAVEVQRDSPETWEQDRITYAHAKLALQSARSGSFGAAAGSLHDFLRAVGAQTQSLDIH